MRVALFGAILAIAGCGSTIQSPSDPQQFRGYDQRVSQAGSAQCTPLSGGEISQAVARTNAARGSAADVRANAALNKIALDQACYMARTGVMSHAGPRNEGPKARAQAAGYAPRIIAENIAAGPYGLEAVLRAWEVSPSHRSNLTLGAVRDMGIAMAVGADGSRYWAAVYAGK